MPKFKRVMTYSYTEKKIRLCRLLWRRVPGDPAYSRSLSLSLWPRLFCFWRESEAWFLTIMGLQMHFKWSRNGTFPD